MTKPILTKLVEGIALVSAVLYYEGWRYANEYFSRFNSIGLNGLDFSPQIFFIHGVRVLFENGIIVLGVVVIGIILHKILVYCQNKKIATFSIGKLPQSITTLNVVLVLCLALWFGDLLASKRAIIQFEEQQMSFASYPRVRVFIKSDQAIANEMPAIPFESGYYKLLIESPGCLYLFVPNLFQHSSHLNSPTYCINKSEIRYWEMISGFDYTQREKESILRLIETSL